MRDSMYNITAPSVKSVLGTVAPTPLLGQTDGRALSCPTNALELLYTQRSSEGTALIATTRA